MAPDPTRPATRYGCPTCDTQGPLLPLAAELTELHRAAHQTVRAAVIVPTQRAINKLLETLDHITPHGASILNAALNDPKEDT